MGCTKCKKKTTLSAKTETDIVTLESIAGIKSQYVLREGISYDQIGLHNPSDAEIDAFLKVNPNRKSLFQLIPDNMKIGLSKA